MITPNNGQQFTVKVQKACFVPDLDAIREFIKELKDELTAHPELGSNFSDDPRGFLGDRGMNSDLQREFLTEIGVGGNDFSCSFLSCVVTDGCVTTDITFPPILPK